MNNTLQELMEEVERLVWEISTTDKEKINSIQNILYQWDQIQDSKTLLVDWSGDMVVNDTTELKEEVSTLRKYANALNARLRVETK